MSESYEESGISLWKAIGYNFEYSELMTHIANYINRDQGV